MRRNMRIYLALYKYFWLLTVEVGSDHDDFIYFSHVRWLSRLATLARFYSPLEEIKSFMKSKEKDVIFMENGHWLNDLAFLVDIPSILRNLMRNHKEGTICQQTV